MPLFSRGPQRQPWHLVSSVLSCPTGILRLLPRDQHLQQPDPGLLCPEWCQSQLIPALGGGTSGHRFLLPRQYLAPTPRLRHSTWAARSEDARGWLGTCRPALHFPEGPVVWPGKGYHSVRRGNWRARLTGLGAAETVDPALHSSSLWWAPACPFLSHFSSPAHRHGKAQTPWYLFLQSQPSPSQSQASPGLPTLPRWGSHDSGMWLGTVSIQRCGVVRCCVCLCESVHAHVCDRDCLG